MFVSLAGHFVSTATIFVSHSQPFTRGQHVSDYKLGRKSETDVYMRLMARIRIYILIEIGPFRNKQGPFCFLPGHFAQNSPSCSETNIISMLLALFAIKLGK